MRIPNVIELNTFEAYNPSRIALRLKKEQNRQIPAEYLKWDKHIIPSLGTLCIISIAKEFEKYPIYNQLSYCHQVQLLEELSTDLDLYVIVPLISCEIYWKKRFVAHFESKDFKKYIGWTWKCVYLEQHVSKVCEEAEPQYKDEEFETIQNLLTLCAPYIHVLYITQLKEWKPPKTMIPRERPRIYPVTHINFEPILQKLTNLQELQICYGVKDKEISFEPRMFSVDVKDCEMLGSAIICLKHIKVLRLHNSAVGDAHIKLLIRKLFTNTSLIELDLSYCQIGNLGAKYIAALLNKHENLKILNLRGNKIGPEGVHGIAWSLLTPEGTYLKRLDLSLNPLGHQGMLNICKALVRGPTPQELSLAACGINGETAHLFGHMLKINTSITLLDISSNDFGTKGGQSLLVSLEMHKNIQKLFMNDTNIPEEIQMKLKEFIKRNVNSYDSGTITFPINCGNAKSLTNLSKMNMSKCSSLDQSIDTL